MFTFKHNRTRSGILSTAIVAGALGLSLASGSALAMGSPTSHDVRDIATRASQGTAVTVKARGPVPTEQPGNKAISTSDAEDYIGGRVGPLPRPGTAR